MVDLNDPVQRKDFLLTQMRLAEEKMKQSKGGHCATSEAGMLCTFVKRLLCLVVLHTQTTSRRPSVT